MSKLERLTNTRTYSQSDSRSRAHFLKPRTLTSDAYTTRAYFAETMARSSIEDGGGEEEQIGLMIEDSDRNQHLASPVIIINSIASESTVQRGPIPISGTLSVHIYYIRAVD